MRQRHVARLTVAALAARARRIALGPTRGRIAAGTEAAATAPPTGSPTARPSRCAANCCGAARRRPGPRTRALDLDPLRLRRQPLPARSRARWRSRATSPTCGGARRWPGAAGTPLVFRAGGTSLNGQAPERRHPDRLPPPLQQASAWRTAARACGSSRASCSVTSTACWPATAGASGPTRPAPRSPASAAWWPTTPAGCAAASHADSYRTVRSLTFVLANGAVIDTAAAGAAEGFAAAAPELAARPARDPRGAARRPRARRAHRPQVRDQEHDRLPAVRVPRRRRRRWRSSGAC